MRKKKLSNQGILLSLALSLSPLTMMPNGVSALESLPVKNDLRVVESSASKLVDNKVTTKNILPHYLVTSNSNNIEVVKKETTKKLKKNKVVRKTVYVTDTLNIRKEPSINAEKIGVLSAGTIVKVKSLEYNTEWYQIKYKNSKAYIHGDFVKNLGNLHKVSSTAYYGDNYTADGSVPKINHTLAGKREWLGKSCYVYKTNKDGTIGECMGYFEFHDTGYGRDGDIPRGETIDIFMSSYSECMNYGRRNVYFQFID